MPKTKREPYGTTYYKTLNHDVEEDYVSYSYIDLIVDYIIERTNTKKGDVKISLSNGDYDINISPGSLNSALSDAAKYDRKVVSIWIKSKIEHFDSSTYGSVEISITLKKEEGYPKENTLAVTVYGVANDRESSQRIIDWGNGTRKGFEDLLRMKQKPQSAEYIVAGGSAKVMKYGELVGNGKVEADDVHTVRLADPVEVKDKGLAELKKPQIYIPLLLTLIGIVVGFLALIR